MNNAIENRAYFVALAAIVIVSSIITKMSVLIAGVAV